MSTSIPPPPITQALQAGAEAAESFDSSQTTPSPPINASSPSSLSSVQQAEARPFASTETEQLIVENYRGADRSGFRFPPHYTFPPFYTLQTNLSTRQSQLDSWMSLVLAYCAHFRFFRLASTSPLFHNKQLNRRFAPEDAALLLAHIVERGRANWNSSDNSTSAKTVRRDEVWIWWKTPNEWSDCVANWVEETGQRNSVLTFYELLQGDATTSQDFYGMPVELFRLALKPLVSRGKATVFGEEDQLGVKFY